MAIVIKQDNRAVIIREQEGHFRAYLYVNTRNGFDVYNTHHADITKSKWSGYTLAGAERWAKKQLK